MKQTEEFFDCEEVHTLGTGVVEDDVSVSHIIIVIICFSILGVDE